MEVFVGELTKKTTILLQPELHERLTRLAQQRRTSIGALVRAACERQYGLGGSDDRLRAVHELAALDLPVGSTSTMKAESVPTPEQLLK